jgi:hypothetical protein
MPVSATMSWEEDVITSTPFSYITTTAAVLPTVT